jgi:hypothetical protein
MKTVSTHNWNQLEYILNDVSLATLKLELVSEYIDNKGMTGASSDLLFEAVGSVKDHLHSLTLFLECVCVGKEFNPD